MTVITIDSEEDFQAAMMAMQSSVNMLGMFDWDDWLRKETIFQSIGPVLDPGLFQGVQKDPQWPTKVALITAAANFMKEVQRVSDER